jgi:hypothetical protein
MALILNIIPTSSLFYSSFIAPISFRLSFLSRPYIYVGWGGKVANKIGNIVKRM